MPLRPADEREIDRMVDLEFHARTDDEAAAAAGALGAQPTAWPFRHRARQELLLALATREAASSLARRS